MRVGTSAAVLSDSFVLEDHPHACGDKQLTSGQAKLTDGSSPCVWGQAAQQTRTSAQLRIIPMRVGTS